MSDAERVLLVASHGGHWVQLMRLKPAFAGLALHFVSTTAGVRSEIAPAPLYVVRDANLTERIAVLVLAWQMLCLVIRVRPHYVVSTGAAPGFFALLFGKLMGARTVWVDSIANVEQLSVSGRWAGRFADLWLTQSPAVARPGGPDYRGAVL